MKYLEQFHYQINGNDNHEKIVFLHGLMGYAANWRRIVSHFEDEFQILTFDQRGHGRSIKPEHGYAPEDFALDLLKIIDELCWEKIHLVGHSMGGRNALNFSSQYPERLITLTLEDIGPESNPNDVKKYQDMLGKVPTPFRSKKDAKEFFQNVDFETTLANYLYSNLVENDAGLLDWRFSKQAIFDAAIMGRNRNRWSEVKAIQTPTLLIRGENSQELPKAMYEKMLQTNKLIEGVIIANAGHWVHFDQSEKFSQTLKTFLYKHQLRRVN